METKWISNARWTKIADSQDTHATEAEALSICERLLSDYSKHSPCPVRGVCLMAWVEAKE